MSDIMVEGPVVSSLAQRSCPLWSMLLKAAVEPDVLVVGEPRSTYRLVAVAENGVYSRPDAYLASSPWQSLFLEEESEELKLKSQRAYEKSREASVEIFDWILPTGCTPTSIARRVLPKASRNGRERNRDRKKV